MRIVFILVALLGLTPTLLNAMYGDVETKKVPTARVITNLERQFQTNPKDPNVAWRIARLHGMAYAQGIDSVDVYTNIDAERFFEEEPPLVHSWVIRPDNEEQETEARQHLQEAIAWYEKAHVLNPWSVVVSLGYGWCLEQVGRKREAIATYREIVDGEFAKGKRGPWPQPQPGVSVVPNKAVTGEALRYLIDLLNPVVDRNELQTRREQLEDLDTWPVWITPIAIPPGDGREIADILRDDLGVPFNLDGSGRDQRWTWIDPAAAWLVHDFGDRSDIKSGRDLFGSVTFWIFWNNGYEALASLDDNGDGWLRSDELRGLKIWRDLDSDGACDSGELHKLTDCGITGLSCAHSLIEHQGRRMWISRDGVEFSDGSLRTSYDVVLEPRSADVASTRSSPKDLTK